MKEARRSLSLSRGNAIHVLPKLNPATSRTRTLWVFQQNVHQSLTELPLFNHPGIARDENGQLRQDSRTQGRALTSHCGYSEYEYIVAPVSYSIGPLTYHTHCYCVTCRSTTTPNVFLFVSVFINFTEYYSYFCAALLPRVLPARSRDQVACTGVYSSKVQQVAASRSVLLHHRALVSSYEPA